MKTFFISFITILFFSASLQAEIVAGVFQTETNEEGNYLHVKFGSCSKDKSKTCGTIKTAFRKGAKNTSYENLGKLIVWDMIDKGDGQYANGKIWDPSSDNDDGSKKIYNSKMSLSGNTLSVSGCILIFCKAQNWTKIN